MARPRTRGAWVPTCPSTSPYVESCTALPPVDPEGSLNPAGLGVVAWGSGFLASSFCPPKGGGDAQSVSWGRGPSLEVVNGGEGQQTPDTGEKCPQHFLGLGGRGGPPIPGGWGLGALLLPLRACAGHSLAVWPLRGSFVPWDPCPCRVLRPFGDGSLPTLPGPPLAPPLPFHPSCWEPYHWGGAPSCELGRL